MAKVLQRKGTVLSNKACTDTLYLIEIAVEDIPLNIAAGQFVHVKIPGMEDHILRRPFSVFYVNSDTSSLVVLYQVVGHGSLRLTQLKRGMNLILWVQLVMVGVFRRRSQKSSSRGRWCWRCAFVYACARSSQCWI